MDDNENFSLQKFLVEETLYKNNGKGITFSKNIEETLFNNDSTIDCLCLYCDKNSTFQNPIIRDIDYKENYEIISNLPSTYHIKKDDILIEYFCSRCKRNMVFLIRIDNDRIIKIGQFPTYMDIHKFEIDEYKSLLGNYNYLEFKKSIGLYSHGDSIAAFTYLRRIVENYIMKNALNKIKKEEIDFNETEYSKSRFEDKVKILKKYLPKTFVEKSKKLYTILSSGIHEMKSEGCDEYYESLKNLLILILYEIKSEEEIKKLKMMNKKF